MKANMNVPAKVIGLVESIELVDKLYGITREEREVLDAMHSVYEPGVTEAENDEWILE